MNFQAVYGRWDWCEILGRTWSIQLVLRTPQQVSVHFINCPKSSLLHMQVFCIDRIIPPVLFNTCCNFCACMVTSILLAHFGLLDYGNVILNFRFCHLQFQARITYQSSEINVSDLFWSFEIATHVCLKAGLGFFFFLRTKYKVWVLAPCGPSMLSNGWLRFYLDWIDHSCPAEMKYEPSIAQHGRPASSNTHALP